MKTKLIFPGFWTCSAPYLSLPCLAAYLKKHGKSVEQIDLNLEFIDRIFTKDFLELCLKKTELITEKGNSSITPYLDAIGKYVAENIEEQKAIMRSEKALDILVYEKCCFFLAMGFAIINTAFPDEHLDHYTYESPYDHNSFRSILQSAQDAYFQNRDTLVSLLTSYFIDDIVHDVDLVGISVTGINQIIPSFVLAAMIKQKKPKIKILLGGSVPTRWFADKKKLPNIFEFVDYVIVNEGEVPIVALVDYLEGKCSIGDVPQLVYLNECDEVTYNDLPITNPDLCSLPTPLFNKDDIRRYLSPVPTLPLLGCRGCYWCKCTFCDHSFVYNNTYRATNIDKVIEDIKVYIHEYGVRYINFHDEAMTPSGLLNLSKRLIQEGLDIKWSTDARLDRGLSYEILNTSHQAGLSILFFGLESINPRIIDLMKKGTHVDVTKRILSDAKKIGIGAHCFFICGFPTETIEEYLETVNFVKENKDIIACQGCSVFSLGRYSPIAREPEKYHVRILDRDNEDSASINFKFERLDVSESYEEDRKRAHQDVTKNLFTYAQKVLCLLFREHWVIYWDNIENTLKKAEQVANSCPLKSGVFPILVEDKLLVFDCATSNVFEFEKDADYLFSLIEKYGCHSPETLAQKASDYYDIPFDELNNTIGDFVSLLKEKGLIYMPKSYDDLNI